MSRHPASFFLLFIAGIILSCKPKPSGGVIENSWWTLNSVHQGKKTPPMDSAKFSLHFEKGQLMGEGPCNSYFAKYTTEAAQLKVGEMGATLRMCDNIGQENDYLGILAKAKAYTVHKDRLEIFCENGRLIFTPLAESEIKAIEFKNGVGRLAALFPKLEDDALPHLYPILRVDNPGDYPYRGSLIDTSFYKYFDAETSGVWWETGGDVMAVGQLDELYICRVPGRYVSSDIALYRIVNNRMTRMETVAWAWCDEGWCNQQDAWLRDIDQDGRLDIIQHYTLTDDKGKIQEERLTVLLQNENGSFIQSKDIRPNQAEFKMAKL